MPRDNETTTVYTAIYEHIRSKILTGQLQPGDLLPSESQLGEEFGVSRATVRKGLALLDSKGFINSKPKVGYFVSQPNQSDMLLSSSESYSNCTTQYSDIHGLLPDKDLQDKLGIAEDRKIIEFSQITRNAEGAPVAYELKFVPYERAYPSVESEIRYAVLPDVTFTKLASFEYYTNIEVSAVAADEKIAAILECKAGDPLLLTERLFIRQDNTRIGYSLHYAKSPYGKLKGQTGHKI